MITLDHKQIIKAIKESRPAITNTLDEQYYPVLEQANWQDDGTGRGFVADYQQERWYIVLEKPVLVPVNKQYQYSLYIAFHLRKGSKYDSDCYESGVSLYNI